MPHRHTYIRMHTHATLFIIFKIEMIIKMPISFAFYLHMTRVHAQDAHHPYSQKQRRRLPSINYL